MTARANALWFLFPALAFAVLCGARAHAGSAGDLASARQMFAQERWAATESLATAALAGLERATPPDSIAIAEGLYLVGYARWRRVGYADSTGRVAAVKSLGIRERQIGSNSLATAEVHSLMARYMLGTDRADSAVVHTQRAIAIRQALLAPNDTLIAKAWDQLAIIHRDRRDFRGALDAWDHAIAIRKNVHGPDHPEVARLMAQTGVPWMELGDLDRARQVLEDALAMFDRTTGPDYPGRWIPLNILSDLERRSGNVARDIDLVQESTRIARLAFGENSREVLTMQHNLALALGEFGDYAGAKATHERTLPPMVAQYGAINPRTLMIRTGIAEWNVRLGEQALALREFQYLDSVMSARKGPPTRDLSSVQYEEAGLFIKEGRIPEARAMAERAVATERSVRQPTSFGMVSSQQVLLLALEAAGDSAAVERARVELARLDTVYALRRTEGGSTWRYHSAHGARWLGHWDEAWTLGLEADQLAQERLRLNLEALPDRRAVQYARQQEVYLDFLVDLCGARRTGEQELVWDRLVRARGLVRAELARRRTPQGLASDTAVVHAHATWIEKQGELARQVVSSGRDSLARARVERLRTAAESAEGAYARTLASRGVTLDTTRIGLPEVRAKLAAGQALIAFVEARKFRTGWSLGDTSVVYAFVARGGNEEIAFIDMGLSSALLAALEPWRSRLGISPGPSAKAGSNSERNLRRLGQGARAVTWDRIAPVVSGATDIYLVGDGPLLEMPWHALPDGANGYLVEAGPRLHILNAERELAEPRAASPAATGSMLAVGAPDYDSGVRETSQDTKIATSFVRSAPDPCSRVGFTSLGPLPGSLAEAEVVARIWDAGSNRESAVLTGPEATEVAFKRDSPGRTVLHLATHGVVATDTCAADQPGLRGVGGVEALADAGASRPSTSAPRAEVSKARPTSPWAARRVWLALAGANRAQSHEGDENEGFLTGEEVVTLDLAGTDWVVLSACHSGLSDAWSREGSLGMRRAFDLAGARTVIASQWAVEDDATRVWMEKLYEARAAGASTAAQALESASRAVLAERRKAKRSTHPFYWAAFSASGE